MKYQILGGLLAVFAVIPMSRPASASDVQVDLEIGTEVPIAVGGTLALEWSSGLRASTGLGYLPGSYVALINEVVQSFPDSYDAATGDLIEETLQNSLIWRTHVGWRLPHGMYVDGGYGLAALGGGTSTEALLSALTAREASSGGNSSRTYSVGSVLHMLDLEFGWKTVFQERFTFRTGIGVAATVAASASVKADELPTQPRRQNFVKEFEDFSEEYLVDTYTTYVFSPVLTIAFGYRLF